FLKQQLLHKPVHLSSKFLLVALGLLQDWSRNHTGDPELDAICRKEEDPGLELVSPFCLS
ncbi:hypothetical protein B296_00036762, partial [Ensete ventricosum]